MMRKRVAFLVAILMVIMLIPCTVFGEQSDPVDIPDSNLKRVIRQQLDKFTGDLTRGDLETAQILRQQTIRKPS